MADRKISELTNITGANLADDDEFPLVDTSADETKAITFGEFKTALDTATGFVRITGDTMTGALDVQSTITADGLTVDGNAASSLEQIALSNSNTSFASGIKISASFDSDNEEYGNLTWTPRNASQGYFQVNNLLGGSLVKAMEIDGNDISFYEATGTTPKFFWDASAESLGLGATSFSGETLRMERSGDMILGLFSGASNSTFLNMGTTSNRDAGQIGYTQSSNHMFFRVNDAERMRIDSSGNVGIGVSNPSNKFQVSDPSGGSIASFTNTTSADLSINLTAGVSLISPSTGTLALGTSNTERMRIGSTGTLTIGKTAEDISTAGHAFAAQGYAFHTRDGNTPLFINRLTSDGDVVEFRKDGTTVGSIKVASNRIALYCSTANSGGIRFSTASPSQPTAVPTDNTGADSDATQDLGLGAVRWKDLYLSGGVYLGGTGAANKLDDYEEGTWTPVLKDGSVGAVINLSASYGYYTKIGRQVTVYGYSNRADGTAYNSTLLITGLPFTTSNLGGYLSFNGGAWSDKSNTTDPIGIIFSDRNTTTAYVKTLNQSQAYFSSSDIENTRPIYFTFHYLTDS